jgi:hypothetical protein
MRLCDLPASKITGIGVIFIVLVVLGDVLVPNAYAQTPIRLTANTGNDFSPAWDPRGQTIAYVRQKGINSSVFDAYRVLSSGQGGEQPLLTGLNTDFGVAVGVSWIGSTGFLAVEEAISGFEVLRFDTALAPFGRTAANGSDTANSLLLSINGGGGGGLTRISRDGLSALVRLSTFGSLGLMTVRSGPVASMVGQVASQFGSVVFSTTSTFQPSFLQGGAISPDGSFVVIPIEFNGNSGRFDLILRSTSNVNQPEVNLTNTSRSDSHSSINPDISPDGKTIVFSRSPDGNTESFDLYTIGIDGTGLTQLTNTPNFSETSPSWAPDGTAVAFVGTHIEGRESDAPALEPGESTNANVYLLSLVPINTVTPNTKLFEPPLVEVIDRSVQFTLTPFKNAAKKLAKSASAASTLQFNSSLTSRMKAKISFRYDLVVKPTAGTRGATRRKLSSRNIVTFRNVLPGSYTSKYRVQIQERQGSKIKIIGRTKFSPSATFTVN